MTDNITTIGCPKCVSFADYKSEEKARAAVSDHNRRMHDEDGPAMIIEPDSTDSLDEFVDEAREVAPSNHYKELIKDVTRGNTPFEVHITD